MHPLLLKVGMGAAALAAGGGFAVFGASAPASAYSSPPLFLDISVSGPATLVAHGAAVSVPVTYTCSSGSDAYIYLTLTEAVGKKSAGGSNQAEVGCTDHRTNTVITIPSYNATAFAKGTGYVQAEIDECYYTCGYETNNATIKIK